MSLLDIGYILEAELTHFPDRLDVKYTQEREKFTTTPRFFSGHLKKKELTLTNVGKGIYENV